MSLPLLRRVLLSPSSKGRRLNPSLVTRYMGSGSGSGSGSYKGDGPQIFDALKVTKDGFTVAKSIEFMDKMKNMGTSPVKQVANATNDVADDGTKVAAAAFRKVLEFWKSEDATTLLILMGFTAYIYNEYKKDQFRDHVMEKLNGIRDAVGASTAPKDPRCPS